VPALAVLLELPLVQKPAKGGPVLAS
jgi:hypothetical protein